MVNAQEAAEAYAQVKELYLDEGMSAQAIAQHTDLSERQVLKYLKAQHLYDPGRDERAKQARARAAAVLADAGKTYEEIAKELDFADRSGAYRAVQSHRAREETHARGYEKQRNGTGIRVPEESEAGQPG